MEQREWIWNGAVIIEKDISEWKASIEKAKTHALAEAKANVFKSFLKKL
jgi:hypothetical protein